MKRFVMACALLLAGGPAAQALEPDVNLSGTFGLSLSWFQDDSTASETTDVDVENNASNFRLEAAAQEVGLRAFIAYERGASNDRTVAEGTTEDVREFFGGISGRYGTLVYGRKATDYRQAGDRLDPFYNTSVAFSYFGAASGGFAAEGASYGLSNLTNGYTSNTIAVRTPTFRGFSGNGAAYVNEQNNQGAGDEADFALGVGYANSAWLGLDVGVQALDLNGNVVTNAPAGESNAYRLHGSIGQKLWAFGLSLELIDVDGEDDPRQYGFLSASYQVLEDLRLAVALGTVADTPSADGSGGTVGAFFDLTRNLTTYAAVRHVTLDDFNENRSTVAAAGVKFVFDVDL